jgi:hypothetical protein
MPSIAGLLGYVVMLYIIEFTPKKSPSATRKKLLAGTRTETKAWNCTFVPMASGVPIKYSVVPAVSEPTIVCTARVERATRRMRPPAPLLTSTTYKYCCCGSKAKSVTALNVALVPIPSTRLFSHPSGWPASVDTTRFFVITRTAQFPESATYTFWSTELSQQKSPIGELKRAFVPVPST